MISRSITSLSRYQKASATTITAIAARGVGLACQLATVPLCIGYLGKERYGVWMAITSITAVIGFADLGIGNSLLNAVARSFGSGNRQEAREYVSTSFFTLLAVASVFVLITMALLPLLNWESLLNVHNDRLGEELKYSVFAFVACFAATLPFCTVEKVQLGLQEGFYTYGWQILGSVSSLIAVVTLVHAKARMPLLVAAVSGGPLLALIINWIVQFYLVRPWLRPAPSLVQTEVVKKVLTVGAAFLLLNIHSVSGPFLDTAFITQLQGPAALTVYNVASRPFGLVTIASWLFINPYWAAYAEAHGRNDFGWIRRTLKITTAGVGLIIVLGCVPLALFGDRILNVWTHSLVKAPPGLMGLIALQVCTTTIMFPLGVVLLAGNQLRFTAITTPLLIAASIPLRFSLCKSLGLNGIPLANALCQTIFVTIPLFLYVPRYLRQSAHLIEPQEEKPTAMPVAVP